MHETAEARMPHVCAFHLPKKRSFRVKHALHDLPAFEGCAARSQQPDCWWRCLCRWSLRANATRVDAMQEEKESTTMCVCHT